MQFERLELLNFGSYYGEHSINLTCAPDKPVVIVLGGTGYGKTNLFDAINWSLYGIEYEADLEKRRKRKIVDYVNESALREAEQQRTSVKMSSTLHFEHEGIHYYIEQSLVIRPQRDGKDNLSLVQSDRKPVLKEVRHGGDHIEREYSSPFLDEILPSNVRDYFLFDGDRIHNLSNPGSSQEVRDAIYRVVDLELLDNAREHLTEAATEYRRLAGRESTDKLGEIEHEYAREREQLEQLKNQERVLKDEVLAIETQIGVLEEKLGNLPDTSQLQERRSQLARQIVSIERQLDETVADLRKACATAALGIAAEPVRELVEEINARRQTGQIPKTISQTLLQDLLRIQRCICGTEFQEGDQVHQTLVARLEQERNKSSGQEALNLFYRLQAASELITNAVQQVRETDDRNAQLEEQRKGTDLAIKQVDSELELLPKEDVAVLTKELRQRREALVSANRKLGEIANRIVECQRRIGDYEKKREELGKKQAKVHSLQRRERIAQHAADKLEEIYGVFAEESRRAVEELTRQEFHQFVRSGSGYEVALTPSYELQVLDSQGNRALQRLSMGQSQCLSLAFITAIARVSEKNPPLVIDMPFGRLDQQVHDEVSARLPDLTNQLILFLIPGIEWNEITSKNLSERASQIYELAFDSIKRETTIVERA